MCDKCRLLQEELSRRRFACLLCRVHVTRAPAAEQFDAMRQLNEAELQLRAAEEAIVQHRLEHASGDGGS